MINFDAVSKNYQLVRFVKRLKTYFVETYGKVFLFGSAIWRLQSGEYDETKNDLDFLLPLDSMDKVKNYIESLCPELGIELSHYNEVHENHRYKKIYDRDSPHIHVNVVLDGYFKIDLIFCWPNDFISDMSDFSVGMLLYDLIKEEYVVAHKCNLSVETIMGHIKQKYLSYEYITSRHSNVQTKFYRLMKYLRCGFTIDPAATYLTYDTIIDIFTKSFYLPNDYSIVMNLCSERSKWAEICTCQHYQYDSRFVKTCLTSDAYQFIKQLYLTHYLASSREYLYNGFFDRLISFGLYMKDFDFAKSVLERYHLCKSQEWNSCQNVFRKYRNFPDRKQKFDLLYIPMLLRQNKDFELTKYFLDFFNSRDYLKMFIQISCAFGTAQMYESFSIDAFWTDDIEYYKKLVEYDAIFELTEKKKKRIESQKAYYCKL